MHKLKIAAVHSGGEKSDGSGSGKSAVRDITDQYYKKEEYKKISIKQKQKLYEQRKKEKKGVTFDDSTTTSPRTKISALKAKNAALEAKIAKLESNSEQGLYMEVSGDNSKQKPSGNKNYSALTQQKKRKSWLWSGTVPSCDKETGPNGTASLAPVYSICIRAASSSICGETRVECDSHADTSVVGKEALIIHDYGWPVSVYSYDKEDGCKEYCTVSAGVAYDNPQIGQVYLLVINPAIEIPHLHHHLLCPM